jgi:hypothetical protein
MSNDLMQLDMEQLELLAQQELNQEASSKGGATLISTRNGRMSLQGMPIPNDLIEVVILCAPIERLYYAEKFDGAALVPPDCAAMASMAQDLKPFDSSLHPQSDSCEACPQNVWGSAGEGRKGKACRETRRIVFLTSDAVKENGDPGATPAYAIRPPVTSLSNWSTYVKTIAMTLRKPLFAVRTRIKLVPDAKNQFKMNFEFISEIKDQATLIALMGRGQREVAQLLAGPQFQREDDEGAKVPDDGEVPF